MGLLIPRNELSIDEIRAIREATTAELLARAQKQRGYTPNDLIVRKGVYGDADATDWIDLADNGTSAVTGAEEWLLDSALFTAGDLKTILVASETVNTNTWMGVIGWWHVGGAYTFVRARILKGSVPLAIWDLEQIYAAEVGPGYSGYTKEPLIFDAEEQIDLQLELSSTITVTSGVDYHSGFDIILVEPVNKHIA